MKALSLDPASEVMGFAVTSPPAEIRFHAPLHECGRIEASRRKPAMMRIRAMAAELRILIAHVVPDVIVIEETTGKVSGRHGGGGAGLSIYGEALGYTIATCDATGIPVVLIYENEWIRRGMGKKLIRRQAAAAAYPGQYNMESDPGGDVADAIGLGRYYHFRRAHDEARFQNAENASGPGSGDATPARSAARTRATVTETLPPGGSAPRGGIFGGISGA